MLSNGYVLLHRKIQFWALYTDPNCIRVLLHLLIKAQWKNTRVFYRGCWIELETGQVAITISDLCKELRLTRKQVRRALELCKEEDAIRAIPRAKTYMVITISNYKTYQDSEMFSGLSKGTSEGHGKGQQNEEVQEDQEQYMTSSLSSQPNLAATLVGMWNEKAALSPVLSHVRSVTARRERQVRVRCKSDPRFHALFAEALTHLPVANDARFTWQPDFDWMIANDTNVYKLVEGRYDRREPAKPAGGTQQCLKDFR